MTNSKQVSIVIVMMDSEKKIIGRWVDIRNNSSNFYKLIDYFDFKKNRFSSIIRNLDLAVEEGILEYKKTSLFPVFRLLEDLKFRAISLTELQQQQNNIDELLFVILVQRLFTSHSLKITDTDQKEGIPVESIEIKTILKDILNRIKENPELRKHSAVKNILVQFTIYKNENETMKKLMANIKTRSSASFYENFKATFAKIFASIRKNYEILLSEDAAKNRKKNILLSVPIKQAGSILFRQAKDISRISTMLGFAFTEKYKIREMLLPILRAKEATFATIQAEENLYVHLSKEVQGSLTPRQMAEKIALRFSREIIIYLEKYMNKEFNTGENET